MVKNKSAEIKDSRFQKIYSDPRFRTLAVKERKLQVDERFKSMFTNSEFQVPVPMKVDERGVKVDSVTNPLAHLYDVKDIQCIDEEGNFKWDVPSSSESEEEEPADQGKDIYAEQNAPLGNESKRIAVMNCDWKIIKAVDLLSIFRSIHPGVTKVAIYPSDFGKQRMEHESQFGPAIQTVNAEIDEEALRKYELELLKYYYAVVDCESIEVAVKIYDECDGLEIERTSNVLDLRFIPDDLNLPYLPTETATEIPKNYKILEFYTKALQHSRVTLTWDETPKDREYAIRRAFASDEIDDEEISKFVATPSPDRMDTDFFQQNEEEHVKGTKNVSQFNKLKERDFDIEIKFHSAFDQIGKDIQNNNSEKTVWEKHLEKKAQKKKKDREERKKEFKERKNQKIDKKSMEMLQLLVDSKGEVPDFKVNADDERFAQLYKDPAFGIDPTSNKFKIDADGNKLLLNYQIKKRKINLENNKL